VDFYNEQCEAGVKDYCGWHVKALTIHDSYALESYLHSVGLYIQELRSKINLLERALGHEDLVE